MLQIVQLPSSAKLAAASIPNTRVDAVVYVEDTRTIVIWSSDLQSEAGCNEDRHPNVTAIAVPPIAVPPIAVPPGNRPKP